MKKLFEERNHIENLLNTRFNFFLLIFASILASSFAVKNPNQLFLILIIGSSIETLLAFVIYRSERKLHLLLREIYNDKESAASIINDRANKGFLNFSMRRIISNVIPVIISITLIFGTIYHTKVFKYLNTGTAITNTKTIENRLLRIENEIAILKPEPEKKTDMHSLVIGFLAVGISIASLIIVIVSNRKNARIQRAIFHLERNLTFEGRLSDWPAAFDFYGVDLEEAEKEGITKEHITYLILSINTLSSIAMYHGKKMSEELDGNTYRERMFENETTRKTWKYVRRFFGKKTIKAIDEYLEKNFNNKH